MLQRRASERARVLRLRGMRERRQRCCALLLARAPKRSHSYRGGRRCPKSARLASVLAVTVRRSADRKPKFFRQSAKVQQGEIVSKLLSHPLPCVL